MEVRRDVGEAEVVDGVRAHPDQAPELRQIPDTHTIPGTIGLEAGGEAPDVWQLPSLVVVHGGVVELDVLEG